MSIPREVQDAFKRKVDDIIASVDKLSEDAVARALKLAEETRQEILNRLLALPGDSFEARHLKELRSAVDRAIADLVRRYSSEVSGLLERAHELGIDLAEDPLKAAATLAAGAAPVLPGGVVGRQALEVLQGFSADLIQGIGFEARRQINGILAQAALGGMHSTTAIKRIAGELPNRSVFASVASRASTIYRTEVGRAFSMTAEARMGQMHERLPGLKKEWVAFLDDRTRSTHVIANGQIRPVDKLFSVGGHKAKFPRDPQLPADESINCRCVHVPVLDDVLMADLGVTGREVGSPAPTATPEPVEAPAPVPDPDAWLDRDITNIEDFPTDTVNKLYIGKIGRRRVLIKPESQTYARELRSLIAAGKDAAREQASFLVAKELDVYVPALRIRDVEGYGRSIVTEFLSKSQKIDRWAVSTFEDIGASVESKRAMALLDSVIGNEDRHFGNMLILDGELVPIDHGLTFPVPGIEEIGANVQALQWAERYDLELLPTELGKLQAMLADRDRITKLLLDTGLDVDEVQEMWTRILTMTGSRPYRFYPPDDWVSEY